MLMKKDFLQLKKIGFFMQHVDYDVLQTTGKGRLVL